MAGSTLGVAIHGTGWVSGEHIKAYARNPFTRVVAVASRTRAGAEAKIAEVGLTGCRVYDDFDAMIADPAVDVVSICTPNHFHAAHAIRAAEAGKHLLIEKPIALNMTELRALRAAVGRARVKTVVGFVLRWDPFIQLARSLIADGTIGPVFLAEIDYLHEIGPQYALFRWAKNKEQTGGPMLSGGSHAVDCMRALVGSEVVEVAAQTTRGTVPEFEYPENVVTLLKFANGAIGKASSCLGVKTPYIFNVELYGRNGTLRNNQLFAPGRLPGQTAYATIPVPMPDSGDVTHHPFQPEIDHLVQCIRDDVESFVNVEDAYKTHEVCLAADLAIDGRRMVRLPLAESNLAESN